MTWSGRKSSAVLTDAYTVCVRTQAVLQVFSVRYTSYELLFDSCGYFVFRAIIRQPQLFCIVDLLLDSRDYIVFQNFYSSVFNTIVVLSV